MTEPEGTSSSDESRIRDVQITDTLTIRAKSPTEEQIAVVVKAAAAGQRNTALNGISAIDITFRVISALLVDKEDIDIIDQGLIDGTVTIKDLMKILGLDKEPDAKQAIKTRTRRGK
jgi:hypothetical protein